MKWSKTQVVSSFSNLDNLRFRNMFGGVGVYKDGTMFSFIASVKLYLRASPNLLKTTFVQAGFSKPLYLNRGLPIKLNYYQVPDEVAKNPEQLREYAYLAWITAANEVGETQLEQQRSCRIKDLPNLSKPYEQLLRKVDITSVDQLKKVGAGFAYLQLRYRLGIGNPTIFLKLAAALSNRYLCAVPSSEQVAWLEALEQEERAYSVESA